MQDATDDAAEAAKQKRFQAWLNRRYPLFATDRLEFIKRLTERGDIVSFGLGSQRFFVLNDPEAIRETLFVKSDAFVKGRALEMPSVFLGNGLITSDGDFHFRQRRMMQPAFHRERIMGYARHMCRFADEMVSDWRDGEVRDVDHEMMRLTLRIVAKTLLDSEVDGEADVVSRSLTAILELFNVLVLPFGELLTTLTDDQQERIRESLGVLDNTIYRIIDERRRSGEDCGDLLSMLLAARDEDDHTGMTDIQVRDEAMTIFLAGHETTANALTWALYLLSENPDKREKIFAEVDRVVADPGPTPEDMPNLKYTESVVAESLRLFPPVWSSPRLVIRDVTIKGVEIPAGSLAICSQYITHKDPKYWPDAESFIPERWETQTVKEATQKCIYFPFAGGTRRCIGEGFAWAEAILVLAAVAKKWQLDKVPDQEVGVHGMVTLRPKYGMRMTITSR